MKETEIGGGDRGGGVDWLQAIYKQNKRLKGWLRRLSKYPGVLLHLLFSSSRVFTA
jgi:hypothetical protein